MLEKLLFNMFAFSFFIIIFFKIIRKNDTNYFFVLLLEAIGISISFIELKLGLKEELVWSIIRYLFAIIIPIIIIFLEIKEINFSEVISVFIAKGMLFFKDTKAAKNILLKLVSKYPESYLGHKLLAEVYEKEGGMRRAIDEYVTAVDINKKDYKSYFKITELLKNLGKKEEAIEMLGHLIKIKPDCFEGACLLGDLLCDEGRLKEAANVYSEALKYNPSSYDLYYNLGIVYTRLSDFQLAKEMYDKAAAINHKLYGANYNLGLIAFIQRDYDAAEKYFEGSLYDDFEAMSYYQLAKIYIQKDEKDKAIIFLNKAIELDSSLLKIAEKEKCFELIREHITVSVKMDNIAEKDIVNEEDEIEVDEDDKPFEYEDYSNGYKRNSIIIEQEKLAREYLIESLILIEDMRENSFKKEIEEKLDLLFKREKGEELSKEKEEAINKFLDKKKYEDIKDNIQKYIENN